MGYNIVGWLDKNKDPINQSVVDLLKESKELLVPVFFAEPAEGKFSYSNIYTNTHTYANTDIYYFFILIFYF